MKGGAMLMGELLDRAIQIGLPVPGSMVEFQRKRWLCPDCGWRGTIRDLLVGRGDLCCPGCYSSDVDMVEDRKPALFVISGGLDNRSAG